MHGRKVKPGTDPGRLETGAQAESLRLGTPSKPRGGEKGLLRRIRLGDGG